MGVNPSTGFEQVRPTAEEVHAWYKTHRASHHYPYRSRCMRCGTRIWHSGLAVGSHRRACKGTFDERVLWFHYHTGLLEREPRIVADPPAWQAWTTWLKLTPDPLAFTAREIRHQIISLIAEGQIEVPS